MPGQLPFADRDAAGRALGAELLRRWAGREGSVVVLGLPRGGIPVAAPVAAALRAPLDVLVVRKLGTPGRPELAMGAVAGGNVRVLDEQLLRRLRIPDDVVEQVLADELVELARREQAYRGGRPWPDLSGRTVVLVDDGLATGASARAAVQAVRTAQPARVVVAVPVGAPTSVRRLQEVADEVVCLFAPSSFQAVGEFYVDFRQTSDEQVRQLLAGTSGS